MTEPPSAKQIAFATEIAETIGSDLPEMFTKRAYASFIEENKREYYKVKGQIKYMLRNEKA